MLEAGHGLIHTDALAWRNPPGDGGRNRGGIKVHLVVKHRIGAAGQALPPGHRPLPGRSGGRIGPTLQVGKGGGVGVDVAAAGAALDRHVAEGHALLHREGVDGRASKFVGVAHTSLHPEAADHMQHQVLGVDPALQLAIHPDAAHLELGHGQALAGQHITHLAGADAKGDRSKGAVGGGVRIAAGHGHAGLGEPQFGGDHMHNPLAATAEAMEGDAVVSAIALQGLQHRFGQGVGKRPCLVGGGHDVVDRGHGALGMEHAEAEVEETSKGLGAGHLMDEMESDEQLVGAPGQLGDPVQIPDLVVKGAGAQERSPI